jgi:hypothetical protein
MSKFSSLLIGLGITAALTGCNISIPNQSSTQPPLNTSGKPVGQAAATPQPVDSFMDVGKQVKIWYLQHNRDNEYQVGFRNQSGNLVWYTITPQKVVIEDEIEVSYIERIPDQNGNILGALISQESFVLHIKTGSSIKGGQIQQQSYDIDDLPTYLQTNMMIGSDS